MQVRWKQLKDDRVNSRISFGCSMYRDNSIDFTEQALFAVKEQVVSLLIIIYHSLSKSVWCSIMLCFFSDTKYC